MQARAAWQVMGIDRVADRLEAEKILSGRAVHQAVRGTRGPALQLVAQIRLADQPMAIPAGKTVVESCLGQAGELVEIPFGRQGR